MHQEALVRVRPFADIGVETNGLLTMLVVFQLPLDVWMPTLTALWKPVVRLLH